MNKKYYILLVVCLFALPFFVKADTSTTFPVDEAGIAAYVKVDNINNVDINTVGNAFYSIVASGESYIIGTVKIENEVSPNYPHLYVGLDGWIVAYYLKNEEASRIMQWKNYAAGNITTNTLKDAIDSVCGKTGLTYSTDIKYYDFEFPDANKLTLVAERNSPSQNDFYVTVPGTLYEASYQVLITGTWGNCGGGSATQWIRLKIDENLVFEKGVDGLYGYATPFSSYGYYDLSVFTAGITHHVVFTGCSQNSGYATLLIYKN
jgi:hypothetical protein